MKRIEVYESSDGRRFESFKECVDYEIGKGMIITLKIDNDIVCENTIYNFKELESTMNYMIKDYCDNYSNEEIADFFKSGVFICNAFQEEICVSEIANLSISVDKEYLKEVVSNCSL